MPRSGSGISTNDIAIKQCHYCNRGVMLAIATLVFVLVKDLDHYLGISMHVLLRGFGIRKKHVCRSNRSILAEPRSVADVIGIHLWLILDITSRIPQCSGLQSLEARGSGLTLTPVSCTDDKVCSSGGTLCRVPPLAAPVLHKYCLNYDYRVIYRSD
jgi:hypothetical protein